MTTTSLPERVQRALIAEQRKSEILIGWVQMGVLLLFGMLYVVSRLRPAGGAVVEFDLIPYALGLYALATIIRLVWAHRWPMPGWSLAGSIVIDMALLMGLIWSFHIKYGQPPAFYLKAPTLLYVFIFIALRALRFDAFYVLLAGATAAAGWLGLVVYAAAADPAGMPTTRDFVTYMTQARILWGAEIDKIVAIVAVSVIMGWALMRARVVLVQAVTEGEAAQDLKRFFSADVALQITGADERIRPGQGEIRDAATMFIDLRGFTKLARGLDANGLVALLAEYQARMVPVIQRHEGSIDKFLGDGILASFGAARPSPHFAADALRAVDALLAEAAAWRLARAAAGLPAPHVGVAVASGPVLFGAVGDDSRLEYTVIGDAVNLAAKLEKHTKAEKVSGLTTAECYTLACAQGYAPTAPKEARPGARVDGVAEPVDLVVMG